MTNQVLATVDDDQLPGTMHPEFEHSRDAVIAIVALMVQCWRRQALELEAFVDDYIRIIAGRYPHQRPQMTATDILAVYQNLIDAWTGHNFPKPAHFQPFVKEKMVEKQRAKSANSRLVGAVAAATALGHRWKQEAHVYEQYPENKRFYQGVKFWDSNKPILDRDGNPMILDHWAIADNHKAKFHQALADLPVTIALAVERAVEAIVLDSPVTRIARAPGNPHQGTPGRSARVSGGAGSRGLPVPPSARYAITEDQQVSDTKPRKD